MQRLDIEMDGGRHTGASLDERPASATEQLAGVAGEGGSAPGESNGDEPEREAPARHCREHRQEPSPSKRPVLTVVRDRRAAFPSPKGHMPHAAARLSLVTIDGVRVHASTG